MEVLLPQFAPSRVYLGGTEVTIHLVSPPQAGSAQVLSLPAALPVSGHRAVLINSAGKVAYPSIADPAHGELIVGLSNNAAATDGLVTVLTNGEMVEPSWSWTPGPVFAGDNGVLTQTPPAGAWIRQVAVAVTATKVIIGARPSILL